MPRSLAVLALLGLLIAPAGASDLSKIDDPSFARTAMLSPKRFEEALCVSMALHESRAKPVSERRDAQRMRQVMVARLAEEIGSADAAAIMVDTRKQWANLDDYPDPADRAERKEHLAEFTVLCRPLYNAMRTGGEAGFAAALSPSSGLIPLRPLVTCLAIAEEQAIQTVDGPKMFGRGQLDDLRALAIQKLSVEQRAAFEATLQAERRKYGGSDRDLAAELLPCHATFRQESLKKERPNR